MSEPLTAAMADKAAQLARGPVWDSPWSGTHQALKRRGIARVDDWNGRVGRWSLTPGAAAALAIAALARVGAREPV